MPSRALQTLFRYLRIPAAQSADELGQGIEAEIAFHLAERIDAHMAEGLSQSAAKRAALARFGDPAQTAVQCHAADIGSLAWWHRLHLAATAALAVVVGALGVISWRQSAQLHGTSPLPPGIASMLRHDWTGDIHGRILDDQGAPIDGAQVLLVVKAWPDQSYFQRAYKAVSDQAGNFSIENICPADERYEVQVAAAASGRVLKSSYFGDSRGPLEEVVLTLPRASEFALRVESEQGGALPGIQVVPHSRIEAASGTEHLVYFDSAQPLLRQTDINGQVSLSYFLPGDRASVLLKLSNGTWVSHEILVPAAGETMTIRISAQDQDHSVES